MGNLCPVNKHTNKRKALVSLVIWAGVFSGIVFFDAIEKLKFPNLLLSLYTFLLSSVIVVPLAVLFWEGWEDHSEQQQKEFEADCQRLEERRKQKQHQ